MHPLPRGCPGDPGVCLLEKFTFFGHSATTYLSGSFIMTCPAKHKEGARPSSGLRQCPTSGMPRCLGVCLSSVGHQHMPDLV